jgi:hypothetical protein
VAELKVLEAHYPPKVVAALLGRSERWVIDQAKAGAFGADVFKDGKGWLLPASGINAYLDRHRVEVAA